MQYKSGLLTLTYLYVSFYFGILIFRLFCFVFFWILLSFIAYTPPTCFLASIAPQTRTLNIPNELPRPCLPPMPPSMTVAAVTSWRSCSPVDSTSGITQTASHCGCAASLSWAELRSGFFGLSRLVLGLLRCSVLHCHRRRRRRRLRLRHAA